MGQITIIGGVTTITFTGEATGTGSSDLTTDSTTITVDSTTITADNEAA